MDEWRSGVYRIDQEEQEALESLQRGKKRREISQRATLFREAQESRADVMDQWRSSWNHLKQQHADAVTHLKEGANERAKKMTKEKLTRLREALSRSY